MASFENREVPETPEKMIQETWRLRSGLGDLARVQEQIQAFCAAQDLPAELLNDVRLVLDEVLSNIIRHGYRGAEGEIAVRASLSAEKLCIEVRDRARPFNPVEAPGPDLQTSLMDSPAGGFGIHIVRQIMDRVEYSYESGENRLLLERRINGPSASSGGFGSQGRAET